METIDISIAELWDKYTILIIKQSKINDIQKLIYINKELDLLNNKMNKYDYINNSLYTSLKEINTRLWNIEDLIRKKEYKKEFDQEFIQLARKVYILNDERANCKNKINKNFKSDLLEIKQYINYV